MTTRERAEISQVWELVAPVAAEEGMEVVEIQCRHEGGRGGRVLRIFLDKEGGPNLDELSRVSRQVSDLLDVHDPVMGPYVLEVSSPGVNRPLKRREHFARFVGKRVRVRTQDAIGGRRSFLGMLKEVTEDSIVIDQEKNEYRIPLALIDKANYEHDWGSGKRP